MATFDIILDSNNELQAAGNDFKTGNNDNNIISYIVTANKGEYKEFPLFGVGILRYLNSTKGIEKIKTEIIRQLKSDVFPNPYIDLSKFPSTIDIEKTTVSFEN